MEVTYQSSAITAGGIVELVFSVILIFTLISLIPTIFYLISLQKAFSRCRPENRAFVPGLVWLLLLPFFSMIWHFFIVTGLSTTLEKEFAARGETVEPQPGRSLGLAMCILNVCTLVPYAGLLTGVASLIIWIMYWIKIVEYSSRLAAEPAMQVPLQSGI